MMFLQKSFGVSTFSGCNLVGERWELLRIAVVSSIFRFPYNTLVSPAPSRQKWSYFSDGLEGGISVYEHALKFQRPSTIKYSHELRNSVSLKGRVNRPLKRITDKNDRLGAHTGLSVLGASHPDRSFRILLKMWGCMAEKCLNHVKENDLIYVNGRLRSYDVKGFEHIMFYEVNVTEINYVAPVIGQKCCGKIGNSLMGGEDDTERWRSALHLWQVFLASPYEWTDLRKSKKSSVAKPS